LRLSEPFRIGILQADSAIEHLREEFGNYPQMVSLILSEAAGGLSFSNYDLLADEWPGDIDECDGYVITGSRRSVYEQEAWIIKLAGWARTLHDRQKPTVGICFGHQLIAHALGGVTEPAPQGWGVGVANTDISSRRDFMSPWVPTVALVVSHKDQVTTLPPGAERLGGNDFCPNGMFVLGKHMLGLQGHPEFTRGYSRGTMAFRREMIGESTYTLGVQSLERAPDRRLVAAWLVNFLREAAARRSGLGGSTRGCAGA
jgi:GMP synthase-like glutamine amidotransferase